MPFGVMNAPAVFQRLMQRVLSGLQFASVYLDDVIAYSVTLEEHVNHLEVPNLTGQHARQGRRKR